MTRAFPPTVAALAILVAVLLPATIRIESAALYFRWAGPTYGLFGLGLCLYFSSLGAGKAAGPVLAGQVEPGHRDVHALLTYESDRITFVLEDHAHRRRAGRCL